MGFFDGIMHLGKSVLDKVKEGGKTLVHLAEKAAAWTDDLFAGNLGTQAVPAPEVIKQVMGGNAADWFRGIDLATGLSKAQQGFTNRTSEILGGLEASWTGPASEAARARIRKFRDVAAAADGTFRSNGSSLSTVAHGFTSAQAHMDPLPNRPDKSFFDVISPWDTDTEKAINNYNKTVEKNLAIYKDYTEQARTGSSQLSIDYGQLGAYDGGAIAAHRPVDSQKPPTSRDPHQTVPPHQPQTTSFVPPQPSPPSPGIGRNGPPRPDGQFVGDRPAASASGEGPAVHTPEGRDGTAAAGYLPSGSPSGVPAGDLSSTTGFGRGVSSAAGAGEGGLGLIGSAGEASRGSRLSGGSGRTGAAPGTAKQTGGMAGGVMAREGVGAVEKAGGRATSSPAGLAPGGGGRGGKGEDRERERKFVLDNPLFTEDERKDDVDPITGLPPVPPTIGA
ncbi:hypothetical protein ACFWY9_10360 [Amycolatopsis sp. NPDC059027]|uniref:hypothetical protein n=1 Tax=Amycolatopsis sp. NPDC059027 TaxID=3346709 RepID=UPI0036712DED